MTPYEAWYGRQPDVSKLKTFGSHVCVKAPGLRHCKLDHNDYTGIFLGYTATNRNIRYIDTTSDIFKTSHHAMFDEAWYLQPTRPPAAQLLYDLGLEAEDPQGSPDNNTHSPATIMAAPWPPMAPPTALYSKWYTTQQPRPLPLPLRVTASLLVYAKAARTTIPTPQLPSHNTKVPTNKQIASELVT